MLVVEVARLDTRGFGTWSGLRIGDLDGDGRADFVLAQDFDQEITCLTAINMDGRILWRRGECKAENFPTFYDLALQVCDLDEDGLAEVMCAMAGRVVILQGPTGRVLAEAPLPSSGATDALLVGRLAGRARPRTIVLKDRYQTLWALTPDLSVRWKFEGNVGHFPWPFDLDGDGRDEIVCGHVVVDDDGGVLWEVDLPGHADAVAIADIDGDRANGVEVAVATCGGGSVAIVGQGGLVRWQRSLQYAQHVVVGDFRPDLPGLEVAAVDRGVDRTATGVDALMLFDAAGSLLWKEERHDEGSNRWLTVISAVNHWDADARALILAFRRGGSLPPRLVDGFGSLVAEFPISDPQSQHFAMHADVWADWRKEIVVWNEREIRVFTNGAPLPGGAPERQPPCGLCNWTHYSGMS